MAVTRDESVNNQISDKSGLKTHGNSSPNLNLISELNPYLEEFVLTAVRRDGGYERDVHGNYVRSTFLTEKDDRTHVFLSAENKSRVASLSVGGLRLYVWIIYTIKIKEDKYWLNTKKFMREMGVTINTMKSAIKELIDKRIILPTSVKYVYFIDPKMIYRGSRLDEYEDKIEVVDSRVSVKKDFLKSADKGNGVIEGHIDDNVSDADFIKNINDIF